MSYFKSIATISLAMVSSTALYSQEELSELMNVDNSEISALFNRSSSKDTEPCEPPPPSPCCDVDTTVHRVRIGANYTYAYVTPKGNPTTHGSLYGLDFLYEYWPKNFVYAGAAFNFRQGNTRHSGGIKRHIQDFDGQERIGYSFETNSSSKFALYTGFGGRYMPEKVSAGDGSVRFNYAQFYVPVGFAFQKEFSPWFNWGVNFQWKPQILPTVNIVPLGGARWILSKHIDNFYVDMPLGFISHRYSLVIDPFFELWHDGYSTAKVDGLALALPGNRYYFFGVNVNFGIDF